MADGVTMTGLEELRRSVDRLPADTTAQLQSVAWRASRNIMQGAQSRVAVKSGYTQRNIHIIEDLPNRQYIVNAGTDRPRVRFALRRLKRSGRVSTQRVTVNMVPWYLEFGTVRMAARPFMRPAADAELPSYVRNVEGAIDTLMRKVFG